MIFSIFLNHDFFQPWLQVQNCGTVFQLIRDKPTLTDNSSSGRKRHFRLRIQIAAHYR